MNWDSDSCQVCGVPWNVPATHHDPHTCTMRRITRLEHALVALGEAVMEVTVRGRPGIEAAIKPLKERT